MRIHADWPESADRILELPVVGEYVPHVLHPALPHLLQQLRQADQGPVTVLALPLLQDQSVVGVGLKQTHALVPEHTW